VGTYQCAAGWEDRNALPGHTQDLYVLRRAVGVYQAIIRRLTAQTTDYRVLLSTFAEGLFTEMDFQNEALNALRMQARCTAGPRGGCCQGCAVSAARLGVG